VGGTAGSSELLLVVLPQIAKGRQQRTPRAPPSVAGLVVPLTVERGPVKRPGSASTMAAGAFLIR